jgi:hypothetical protein
MASMRTTTVCLPAALILVALGCGDGSGNPGAPGGGGGSSGSGGGTMPQLRVSYAGFVGQSFTASDPTPCPTATCAIAAPTQIPRQEGLFSYRVSPGTYRLDLTLNGRPAPLTPPATNVSAALAFSFSWEVVSTLTFLGIERASLRVNGNPVGPNDPGSTGVGCGRYLESFNPSQVIQLSYTFTIVQYGATNRPDICA